MSTAKAQLEKLPRSIQFVLALGAIALAAFPLLPIAGADFYLGMLSQMMILAIFAMSLDLLQGVSGLVSLGHAAYFGLAGYALAFLTPQDAPIALWWSLPLAALAAGLAALVIG
ncbi:MAG: branched-chain amino acid ABC transporter permease, partial [Hydrogenophaga sp.]|nr:branched-chain amino acid ABC transporter permease [Hydrogenophaga sp.]